MKNNILNYILNGVIIIFLILGVIAVPVISYFVWQNSLNKEIAQLHCKSNLSQDLSLDEKFKDLSSEDVIYVRGLVKKRPSNLINPKLKTGKIEIEAKELKIITKAKPAPIPVNTDGYEIDEETRQVEEEDRNDGLKQELCSKLLRILFTCMHRALKSFL